MGAKSTIDITREEAISFILKTLIQADRETLERVVEELNDSLWENRDFENTLGLHNFKIVN